MKLLGVVKFNDGNAFIVDERKPVTYERRSYRYRSRSLTSDLLIGDNEDGLVDVLERQVYSSGAKAFGGHELTWTMKDGTEYTTDGWWWSGGFKEAEELLGRKIGSVPISSIAELMDCYVFRGAYMFEDAHQALTDAYLEAHGGRLLAWNYWLVESAIKTAKSRKLRPEDPVELWSMVESILKGMTGV